MVVQEVQEVPKMALVVLPRPLTVFRLLVVVKVTIRILRPMQILVVTVLLAVLEVVAQVVLVRVLLEMTLALAHHRVTTVEMVRLTPTLMLEVEEVLVVQVQMALLVLVV